MHPLHGHVIGDMARSGSTGASRRGYETLDVYAQTVQGRLHIVITKDGSYSVTIQGLKQDGDVLRPYGYVREVAAGNVNEESAALEVERQADNWEWDQARRAAEATDLAAFYAERKAGKDTDSEC